MKPAVEFFLNHPEWLTPSLVMLEISLLCVASLLVARLNRNDASVRYGIGIATLVLIWLCLPITLAVQAAGWTSWAYTEKVFSGPVYEYSPMALPEPARPTNWLLIVWVFGSAMGGARILHGAVKVWNLKRKAFPLSQGIFVTDEISGPVVVGPLQPAILVPRKVLAGLSEEEFADVLAHEYAHVAKKHLFVAVFQRITAAILWPHPLVHLLNRAIVDAREEICDNVVLQSADPVRYARVLLRVAECRQNRPHVASALGLFGPKTQLEKRVQSLLNPNRRITTEMNTRKLAFAALALTMTVGAIGAARINMEIVPAGVPTDVPKAQPAQKTIELPVVIEDHAVSTKGSRIIQLKSVVRKGKGKGEIIELRLDQAGPKIKRLKLANGARVIDLAPIAGQAAPALAPTTVPPSSKAGQAAPAVTIVRASGAPTSVPGIVISQAPQAGPGSAPAGPATTILVPAKAAGTAQAGGKTDTVRIVTTTGQATTAKGGDIVIVGQSAPAAVRGGNGDVVITGQAAPAKNGTIEYRIITSDGKPLKIATAKGQKIEYRIATDPIKVSGEAPNSKPAYIVTSGDVVVGVDPLKAAPGTRVVYRTALPQRATTWKTTADPKFKSYVWTKVDGKSKYIPLKGGTYYYKVDSSKGVWKVVTDNKKGGIWRVVPDGKSTAKASAKPSTLGKTVPDKKPASNKG